MNPMNYSAADKLLKDTKGMSDFDVEAYFRKLPQEEREAILRDIARAAKIGRHCRAHASRRQYAGSRWVRVAIG